MKRKGSVRKISGGKFPNSEKESPVSGEKRPILRRENTDPGNSDR